MWSARATTSTIASKLAIYHTPIAEYIIAIDDDEPYNIRHDGLTVAFVAVAITLAALNCSQQSKRCERLSDDGDDDGDGTPVDLRRISESFNTHRDQHDISRLFTNKIKKVRSIFGGVDPGPLRGGDWLFDESGNGYTLSFCFKYKSQWYGLTTGHFLGADDDIFVAHHYDDGKVAINKIGKCVSKSIETDSMVFIIDTEWVQDHVIDRALDRKAGLLRALRLPTKYVVPVKGSYLLGFGAQRRGSLGATRDHTPVVSSAKRRISSRHWHYW